MPNNKTVCLTGIISSEVLKGQFMAGVMGAWYVVFPKLTFPKGTVVKTLGFQHNPLFIR